MFQIASTPDLGRLLSSCLRPSFPSNRPAALHSLCLRTAAIYATTALYEFHDKQVFSSSTEPADVASHRAGALEVHPEPSTLINESMWEAVLPLLDAHFLQLIPYHLYEQFLEHVLCALEVVAHFDAHGKSLMQYITLFFPPHSLTSLKVRRCYKDRVLMPMVCCLNRCINIQELYLEKLSDSSAITTYLLAHLLKSLHQLKVLALPKQSDDDVLSIVGLNCPKLECIVLTNTGVSNVGLSWLLCCVKLHTIIMPGFFQSVTHKGVALLLNGLASLRHLVYDAMSDVLTYLDFNSSDHLVRRLALKTLLFHSMELLSSNHLELLTKLCPYVEWLSLDSAFFYSLEGLGHMPNLRLLRLNYKDRPIDDTVIDFFSLSCNNLVTLHLFEIKDITLDDLRLTVGRCPVLEMLVLNQCSMSPECTSFGSIRVVSRSIDHLQLFGLQWSVHPSQWVQFIGLFRDLRTLEMDRCCLDMDQIKALLKDQPHLHRLRCAYWTESSCQSLTELQLDFRHCQFQLNKDSFYYEEDNSHDQRTMVAKLLSEYANFSPALSLKAFA